MKKHIFVGIDLGDKNAVARIVIDREKSERFSFCNTRAGRARLFAEAKSRSDKAGQAQHHMILSDRSDAARQLADALSAYVARIWSYIRARC